MISRKTKIFVVIIAALIGIIITTVICQLVSRMEEHVAWREQARTTFSGCNLAHLNIAIIDRYKAELDLKMAEENTNTPPEEIEALKQRVKTAEAEFQKWDNNVKKYGHLHGTAKEQ